MEDFTLAELGVFMGVVGGIFTSVLLTIQKSKCDKIDCCCIRCHRRPELKSNTFIILIDCYCQKGLE